MAAVLPEGSRVLTRYLSVRREWHERILLKHLTASWYLIVTPDGDVYPEDLSIPPLVEMVPFTRAANGRPRVPDGIESECVYWMELGSAEIRGVSRQHWEPYYQEALDMFEPALLELGVRPPGAATAGQQLQVRAKARPHRSAQGAKTAEPAPSAEDVGTPAGLTPEPGGGAGDELVGTVKDDEEAPLFALVSAGPLGIGDVVPETTVLRMIGQFGVGRLPSGESIAVTTSFNACWRSLGSSPPRLQATAAEPAEPEESVTPRADAEPEMDLRVLKTCVDGRDRRFREYRQAADLLREPTHLDWPIDGPTTVCYCVDFMARYGGSGLGFHNRWKAEARLLQDDSFVLEHESMCRILDAAVHCDQLHCPQLASLELVCRCSQRIQLRYRARFAVGEQQVSDQGGGKEK